jgi:hypothetical protein
MNQGKERFQRIIKPFISIRFFALLSAGDAGENGFQTAMGGG